MPVVWSFPIPVCVLCILAIAVAVWRLRHRMQLGRHLELRRAVRQRTEQLEHSQRVEVSRNRILEMLVSNESLSMVLDAIALTVGDQLPEAQCVILVKRRDGARHRRDFGVGAARGVPEEWLAAINRPDAVPFEVWKQRCDYLQAQTEPALRLFFGYLETRNLRGNAPAAMRSIPIGEPESSLGTILLFYPERPGNDPWDGILSTSARLAQIAIEHRRFCDQLDYQAHHDTLTGLPNRKLLDERLELAVTEAQLRERRVGFLYIDVDEFKQINDRYSHRAGDALLVEVANRINALLRTGDTVARIGGDEFNVLLPDIEDGATAMAVASRLIEAVRQPISIEGCEITVTLSVGMAMFPDDSQEAAGLQRQADAAMYQAKSLGKNRAHAFSDSGGSLDEVRMEKDLRHALHDGWFSVHYQPKFTAEGDLAGMEALIRMSHPVHGQIPPDQFISIAESSGLIVPIGAWVIAEVCRQIAEWRRRNLAPVVVAVNVSSVQIARSDFAMSVESCLAAHSVPACCLELELTERLAVSADSEEHRQMQFLRAMGVTISIDDFGTGFSSLSYLHRLQIDAIKLDKSFVQTIDTDKSVQHLVRAMIGVAQGLGLDVIAEGVETEAQRLQLVAAGCPVMQGYLFARPGLPETVEPFLRLDRKRLVLPDGDFPGADLSRLYGALESVSKPVPVLSN